MFSRLAQSVDRPGSGIGLAICHRVVQAHGGRMWVEDGIGGGARLCFTLPA
jgi:signal transduction histidine kinase